LKHTDRGLELPAFSRRCQKHGLPKFVFDGELELADAKRWYERLEIIENREFWAFAMTAFNQPPKRRRRLEAFCSPLRRVIARPAAYAVNSSSAFPCANGGQSGARNGPKAHAKAKWRFSDSERRGA